MEGKDRGEEEEVGRVKMEEERKENSHKEKFSFSSLLSPKVVI